MNRRRLAEGCYAGALFTLPWAGLGVVHFATGRDLGAGVQLSWVLLALAVLLRLPDPGVLQRQVAGMPRAWRLGAAAVAVSVLASAGGLLVAPVAETTSTVLLRYAKQIAQLAIMAAFAAWPALWTRTEGRWRWTARWLVGGALFQLGYGVLQEWHYFAPGGLLPALEKAFTSNPAILSGSDELYAGGRFLAVPRLRGTICEPLYLGNYLLAVIPLVGLTAWPARLRRMVTPSLLLLLLLTWSRGAWLAGVGAAAAAGLLALAATQGGDPARSRMSRRRRWLPIALVAAAAALLGAALAPDTLGLPLRRLLQTFDRSDWSNLTRLYSLQAGWRAFLLSPVCGIGWGQFGFHFPALVDPLGLQAMVTWPVVANYPLRILCETGLLGFGVFAGIVAAHGRQAAGWGRGPAVSTPARRAAFAAMVGVGLQLLTFSQYNLPHIWVAWGLLLAAGRGAARGTAEA